MSGPGGIVSIVKASPTNFPPESRADPQRIAIVSEGRFPPFPGYGCTPEVDAKPTSRFHIGLTASIANRQFPSEYPLLR